MAKWKTSKSLKRIIGSKTYKFGLREPRKNPVFFRTKKERDIAIKKTKKGAWIINLKT